MSTFMGTFTATSTRCGIKKMRLPPGQTMTHDFLIMKMVEYVKINGKFPEVFSNKWADLTLHGTFPAYGTYLHRFNGNFSKVKALVTEKLNTGRNIICLARVNDGWVAFSSHTEAAKISNEIEVIPYFKSAAEFMDNSQEAQKQKALEKLTPEERRLLGLL